MERSRIEDLGRTLLYLVTAVPLGAVGFALLLAGWIAIPLLAITPLVGPALVGYRALVGWLARAEAAIANRLLGTDVRPRVASPGPRGYWRSAANVLADPAFWAQQAFHLLRCTLGFGLVIGELTLIAASVGAVATPITYRWSEPDFGSWHVDTLGRALLFVPAGIAGLLLALWLLRPLAALSRSLATGLLDVEGGARPQRPPRPVSRVRRRHALVMHAVIVAGLAALLTLIWAVTTRSYYWPEWALLPLGLLLAVHAWVVLVDERPEIIRGKRMTRSLALHEGVAIALSAFLVLIWAVTTRGYFWPMWPIIAFAAVFASHVAAAFARRGARIAELETTRAGAVDQQEAELRRIERDLHDGAQARLVALGMSLGMAEQKLASDPAAAQELLADARRGAQEALSELRDLARGIHPPVLADRGLEAAIAALANRTPLKVNLTVDLPERPAPTLETATYFVVAEALANTGKHARAEQVDIRIRRKGDDLVVDVIDDGTGGADPNGNGLRGLARRVEALDGRLEISSPPGGPTSVRAVMPCAS